MSAITGQHLYRSTVKVNIYYLTHSHVGHAIQSLEGSHFEDHAVLGRISESHHPRLTGSALPLSPKHEPCPNHPRHPVLLDKALFAQKTRDQKANEHAAANPATDGDGNANVGDNAGGNATADAHPAFRSVEHLHRSPSKKLSHFSLRSLPSRLFKRREREKIDFHRLYTETSAVEVQRMQEDMSHQMKAMEEESRKVSLTIKNKDKDDRSGSHFEAYTKREWSKESKESANGEDNGVEHDNAVTSAKATAKQKEKVDVKGKKRETSGSQSQPSAILPDSTWKSLGAAINRTPSRKFTEAVPDRTASIAGAVAATHTRAASTPPKKDHQPSNATVIASARASGGASKSERDPSVSRESRSSSRADKDVQISPENSKSEKRSRSRRPRSKEPSNPFLTQSGNQIEDPIVETPGRLSMNEAEQAKTTNPQIEPTARKTSPAEAAQPESDSRKGRRSKKEKKRMKGSITEQLASLPFGEQPHEDTISVSRAMT
ncbi:hypothetical protein KEM56_004133 [Ascosphaera pollenicola]|nr:hypothetical protein KEM56_004133 [Ascosphaera pollenicola]